MLVDNDPLICIFTIFFRYNVDCAAAEGLYGLAEGAFGSDGGNGNGGGDGGGQCPNANPLSDAECAGAVSNCWSPGQPDTDCPNYGLCCFDGCANTCVDGEGNYFLVKMIYEWFNPPLFFHFWARFFQCPTNILSMVKVTIFLSKCSSEYWSMTYSNPPLYSIFGLFSPFFGFFSSVQRCLAWPYRKGRSDTTRLCSRTGNHSSAHCIFNRI